VRPVRKRGVWVVAARARRVRVTETRYTCNVCGQIWHSTLSSVSAEATKAACCCGIPSAVVGQPVRDFNQCPACGSRDVRKAPVVRFVAPVPPECPHAGFLARLLMAVIRHYKTYVSPVISRWGRCRFYPTCSDYALGSIQKYGALRGSLRAAARIVRCNARNRESCIDAP
jgi:putative membrane protein insertion efficiency factor